MRRLHRRIVRTARGDAGSVLLLTLGYAALAIVAILVCVNATSLYLAQKRLDGLADAAALAGADGYTLRVEAGRIHADLDDAGVRDQAEALVAVVGDGAVVVTAGTADGTSARVTVRADWHPPLLSLFVPDGLALQATATSRTALN
ncbi:MAG: pilus assembly protein TadG-related protein [Microbacterium sp.]|uniref:pilus assembly protein TadG-related protein n=1 Tax=Microbacterium sp. TaxID=51671 RepID=UPI003A844A79